MIRKILFLFSLVAFSMCGEAQKSTSNLSNDDFKNAIKDSSVIILDVRTSREYTQLHIPHAKNIDISSPNFQSEILSLDKSKEYVIYCRTGNRSGHALRFMQENGFEKVGHLSQGIVRWDGPTEKGS